MSLDLIPIAMQCHTLPDGLQPDKWKDHIIETAKSIVTSRKVLEPCIHILGTEQRPDACEHARHRLTHYFFTINPFMQNEGGKEALASIAPQILKKVGAHMCITITEAWMVSGNDPKSMEAVQRWQERHGSLENHPDRVEVLNVLVESRVGSELYSYPMLRNAEGRCTGLGEDLSKGSAVGATGRFTGWFGEPLDPESLN